jgi:hypothetical protein
MERKRKGFLLTLSILVAIIIITPSILFAAQIRLAWDANSEPDLAGYKVYYGTASRSYGTPVNVSNVTTYTVTGLTTGQTYYLAVTAFDNASPANESTYSTEVSGAATDPAQTVSITVTTNPSGLQFLVGTTTYTAPQTFSWTAGSSYTLSLSSPQSGVSGTRYAYASWSDGGAQSHSITVPSSATTYTANLTTQYSLTTSASPTAGGTVSPSGTNWYNKDQTLNVSATPNSGYSFTSWSGIISGTANPVPVTMDGPKSGTANFAVIPSPGTLAVTPSGGLTASGSQGGPFSPSSQGYTLQNTGGAAINWTAAKTQSWVTLSSTSGSLAAGATATVTASINTNANSLSAGSYSDTVTFTNTTNGSGNTTRSVNLTVSAVSTAVTVATNPVGLEISVDGAPYTAPRTFNWTAGSSHAISVASPQNGASGTRYVYASWSDGGAQSHSITVPSSATTFTANFTTQYSLTTAVSPSGSGTITANPSATWYNNGTGVQLTANAGTGYTFSSWTGGTTGSSNPTSVAMNSVKSVTANFTVIPSPGTLAVTPSGGLTASGSQGGPFSPSSQSYTLQNTGGTAINWSASKAQNWVTLSSTSGSLAAGATATVTASINTTANSLTTGTYNDTVTFTNTTNSSGNTTRSVNLTVSAPPAAYTLTVNASPSGSGSVSVDPNKTTYSSGDQVTLTATANSGYAFSSWSGDATGTTNPITVTMNANKTVTANFAATPGTLVVTPATGLASSGSAGGPFTPSGTSYLLQNTGGTALNWIASEAQNWVSLSSSSGSLAPGASITVTVSINDNAVNLLPGSYNDTVSFSETTTTGSSHAYGAANTTRPVTLTVNGTMLSYKVATNPSRLKVTVDGIEYKTPKTFTWAVGSKHILDATSPQIGKAGKRYLFKSWSDGLGKNHEVTASASSTAYAAAFTTQYSLTTSVNIPGGGTVNIMGPTASGGNATAATGDTEEGLWYDEDQVVTLTATPNFEYSLYKWSNGSKTNPLSLTMTGPKNIKANFKQNTYKITVLSSSLGVIARSPKKSTYVYGEQVTFTATPKSGYLLGSWTGDVSGAQNPLPVTVTGNMTVGANFTTPDGPPKLPPGDSIADASADTLSLIGELESPADGKSISGVKPIYGWVLDEEGISKVELYIDGAYACDIPLGGVREDIAAEHPQYPDADKSGFAMIWNYSAMPPGEHALKVRVHNLKGETLDLATTVFVNRFYAETVNQVTPQGVWVYDVNVTGDGATKKYDVKLEWSDQSQGFEIIELLPR